ncbi:MAG: AmmeMemoRadiSam system protein A [Deltaproteobacteria bacterium]|nr:AmmeMemoRadiSam system protein A [Deltaproteobacteria bacterium]
MTFSRSQQEALLASARAAIEAELDQRALTPPSEAERERLSERCGVFVTVRNSGRLRGCRGILDAHGPLWEIVPEIARLSAFDDPRFAPYRPDELEGLELDISLLHGRRVVEEPDRPGAIVLGRDGLLLTHHGHRGFLLPQVATEHGYDLPTFLDRLCNKAGLPDGAWRDPGARIEAFEVEHFDG